MLLLLDFFLVEEDLEELSRGFRVLVVAREIVDVLPLISDLLGSVGHVEIIALIALPPESGDVAAAHFIQRAGFLAGIVAKVGDKWDDVFWLEGGEDFLGHDCFSEPASGSGADCIDLDVSLDAFAGEGEGEAKGAHFGGTVVDLAEDAEETGGGGGVDDFAGLLLSHVGPSGLAAGVGSFEVDLRWKVDDTL